MIHVQLELLESFSALECLLNHELMQRAETGFGSLEAIMTNARSAGAQGTFTMVNPYEHMHIYSQLVVTAGANHRSGKS